jgi:carbamoyl-phosphate synthase/aspartate carbamoyltransferase/dihydroorotase
MKIIRLPGFIDIHVHFRDPGQTHKEDFITGSKAALSGGISTVFDMPNNLEPILTYQKLMEKDLLVKNKSKCHYKLYFGTDGQNTIEFDNAASLAIGLKLYLNQTTGNLAIADPELIKNVFQSWPKQKVIVVHAEGEMIDLALKYSKDYQNKVHITHIATEADLRKVLDAKKYNDNLTCDVTPHHLFLSINDLGRLGNYGLVKPALASQKDQDFLWSQLSDIDCFASDHAPHTREEKESESSPYGLPGVETMLPLFMNAVSQKKLTFDDIIQKLHTNPQKIFDFLMNKDIYTEVDLEEEYVLKNEDIKSKCGWTPFHGWKCKGKVVKVYK